MHSLALPRHGRNSKLKIEHSTLKAQPSPSFVVRYKIPTIFGWVLGLFEAKKNGRMTVDSIEYPLIRHQ